MHWGLAAVLGVTAVVFSAVAEEDSCVGTAGVSWSSGLLQGVMFDASLESEFSLVFLSNDFFYRCLHQVFAPYNYDLSSSVYVIVPFFPLFISQLEWLHTYNITFFDRG